MPKINVYLPDDLAEAVKDAGVPVSAVCQRALEQAVRRVTSIRSGLTAASSAVNFTRRAWSVVKSAQVSAGAEGLAEAGTEHLLRALVVDGRMAINVLTALEITPHQILAALPSSGGPLSGGPLSGGPSSGVPLSGGPLSGGPLSGGPSEPVMSRQLVTAIELAANESSGLGNHYVGSEHLLLGLIGEPEGAAGRVLRSLGADLRVTRRTVAAALAGWGAGFSAHEERAAQPVPSEQLSLAIRAELEPLLARLDRLERPRQVVKDP
jgi:ATP-dependent Clp protease ATP-binding subunit ClpA